MGGMASGGAACATPGCGMGGMGGMGGGMGGMGGGMGGMQPQGMQQPMGMAPLTPMGAAPTKPNMSDFDPMAMLNQPSGGPKKLAAAKAPASDWDNW